MYRKSDKKNKMNYNLKKKILTLKKNVVEIE